MADYSTLTTALTQTIRAQEAELALLDETCHSIFLLHPDRPARICLFFHGFTATPGQFLPIGKMCFEAGCNVLIPLLPGHGLAGAWDGDRPPPLPEDQQVYQEFGLYWLQQAQQLGNKVIIGGLSGGSTLAAWLALERPQEINRALLFAPYLSGTNWLVDWCVRTLDVYFEWKTAPNVRSFGYKGFAMPALRLFLGMGEAILKRAESSLAAPLLVVSSKSDYAVGREEHRQLFSAALHYQPKCWYHCFEQAFDTGHNMMTEIEGNDCIDLVFALARAFIESDITWIELQQIRDRITQGEPFEATIVDLQLQDRVSPDLLTVATMVNAE